MTGYMIIFCTLRGIHMVGDVESVSQLFLFEVEAAAWLEANQWHKSIGRWWSKENQRALIDEVPILIHV